MQCLLLGGAAIPLYRFAARRLPPGWALLVVGCYVLYPPLHGAQLFDFHFQPVAAAFLLAAIDAFDSRRMRLFWFFWLLAIGCREDVSMGTAIVGLTLVLAGVRVRQGAAIAIASAIYFVLMRFVIMPAVGPWGFADIYKQLFPAGESSFLGVLKTMATNPLYTLRTLMTPEKLRYGLQILVPLAFLPLRRWWLAASIVPGAVLTLLTTEYGPTLDIGYQYGCDFVPYVFPAAALALAELRQQPGRVNAARSGRHVRAGDGTGDRRLGGVPAAQDLPLELRVPRLHPADPAGAATAGGAAGGHAPRASRRGAGRQRPRAVARVEPDRVLEPGGRLAGRRLHHLHAHRSDPTRTAIRWRAPRPPDGSRCSTRPRSRS